MKNNILFWIYLSQFLEWKMFQTKFAEKIKKHFVATMSPSTNHAVYAIMWKNDAHCGRPQLTIWCMCMAYWITNATETCSLYVILIAFPLQQWLLERPSTLRYTFTACWVSDFCSFRLNNSSYWNTYNLSNWHKSLAHKLKAKTFYHCGSTV
jgi:hypothetical protein